MPNQTITTMKFSLLTILFTGTLLVSCMAPAKKQLFSDSPDIDLGKNVVAAYLTEDWATLASNYSDTARIWRNVNWTTEDGFNTDQFVEDLKEGLQNIDSYGFDPQIWESVINENEEHWVHFWGVWKGHSTLNDKNYEIPVNIVMRVVDGKIVYEGDIFNSAEIAVDMMQLSDNDEGEMEGEGDDDDD